MSSPKIACVGIAVQDRIYRVDHFPQQGGKYVAQQYDEMGGGPAATAAVAAARLGAQVDFIGRVGDDACGITLLKELNQYGVHTDKVRIIAQAQSSQSAILVDAQGERMIINHQSPTLDQSAQWLEQIDFAQYDVVLADVRWHQGSLIALQRAKQAGVTTLLDADLTPQAIDDLVHLADHVAFSEPGLRRYARMPAATDHIDDILIKASHAHRGYCYVTCGSAGCLWVNPDKHIEQVDGFTVNVVDTTGAGDVFHGALAVAIAEKQAASHALRFANAVAALKCTQKGGRAGIPNRIQTMAFLESKS